MKIVEVAVGVLHRQLPVLVRAAAADGDVPEPDADVVEEPPEVVHHRGNVLGADQRVAVGVGALRVEPVFEVAGVLVVAEVDLHQEVDVPVLHHVADAAGDEGKGLAEQQLDGGGAVGFEDAHHVAHDRRSHRVAGDVVQRDGAVAEVVGVARRVPAVVAPGEIDGAVAAALAGRGGHLLRDVAAVDAREQPLHAADHAALAAADVEGPLDADVGDQRATDVAVLEQQQGLVGEVLLEVVAADERLDGVGRGVVEAPLHLQVRTGVGHGRAPFGP
jgi:hypothetical protein